MSHEFSVQTDDLRRLAKVFHAASSALEASGRDLSSGSTVNESVFGQGSAGRSAKDAYVSTRDQMAEVFGQLAALSAQTGATLTNSAQMYEAVEDVNSTLAHRLKQQI
ncbi:type VII secretion target [Streptomyces sp. PA03-6a]|nr:type VII secretion target [Streptomyces sp. PA03-6a]